MVPKKTEETLADYFLKEFLRTVIAEKAKTMPHVRSLEFNGTVHELSTGEKLQSIKINERDARMILPQKIMPKVQQPMRSQGQGQMQVISPLPTNVSKFQAKQIQDSGQFMPSITNSSAPSPQLNRAPPKLPLSSSTQKIQISGLAKINPILADPGVQSIECPAPGKQLIVNRSGAIQATTISLSTEEIDALMKEVSEKTKIPVTPGVFKAAIGNIIFTAIISEFVGTRFIIQKKPQIRS